MGSVANKRGFQKNNIMEVVMRKGKKWFALLLVFAMLLTSVGRVPVEVQAAKLTTVTVSTQKQLEAAMHNAKVGKIIISTKSKVTLTIPASTGSSNKSLVVNAANATLVNKGSFKAITIEASKKFTESGKGNKIVINEKNAYFTVSSKAEVKTLTLKGKDVSLTVEKGATVKETAVLGASAKLKVNTGTTIEAVTVKKTGAEVNIVADGKVAVTVQAKADISVSGKAKTTVVKVDKKAEGTAIKASTAIKLDTKAAIDVTLKAGAESSTLKSSDKDADVAVKNETKKDIKLVTKEGTISIGKGKEIKRPEPTAKPTTEPTTAPTTAPTAAPTAKPTAGPSNGNGGSSSSSPSNVDNNRVAVNKDGFDVHGRMVAYFGTPTIDGSIDKVWEGAEPVTVKDTAGKTDTTVEFRVLWDDYALYVLAKVKDSALDSSNGSVYEKDSVEIFLDENNNKSKDYGVDDLHFRVNYKNEQSADNGDLSRFYTAAKTVSDGYVVEARIALTNIPVKNQKVYGIELQVNDAKGGKRITTLQTFDKTGLAYADTGLFGGLLCEGKTSSSISGLNPYDLKNLVASSKKIMLERYTNGNEVKGLIADAEAAIANVNTTQKKIDDLYAALSKAVDNLVSDGKDYDVKEVRDIPLKYKTIDEHKGTIERVNYTTNTYDAKNETREKDFLVYLPAGYNAADKSKKYDVLYLLHGYGENQNTVFGGPGQNTEMMKVLDNMIYDGKLKPMIIVTPTYSYKGVYDFSYIGRFHNELVKDIIPTVEAKYNVYAESTSEKDLIAAREHRALGGFSMGSMTTWNTFVSRVEYFKYYMPVSGAFSGDGGAGVFQGTAEEKTAQYLESVVKEAGYTPNDVSIFAATGTDDFASGGMVNMVNAMKKYDDTFIYTADLNKGNFYFINAEGGTHSWNSVNKYLYNVLPDMFNSKKITLDAPSPIVVDANGFDATGNMVANFGTPSIDGTIDSVWDKAVQVSARPSTNNTATTAKFKVLWDDTALYILAEVKDSQLDLSSGNVYDRDSVEVFFDENNDKTVNYNKDDLHFRVSYDNKQSADNGDLGRFYTKTSVVPGGYIVEARLALTNKPVNDTVYGIDLSVNDGVGGKKINQLGVYDIKNEAYKDTSKFGAILLTGRQRGAVSGLNPYDLLAAIEEGKEIKLDRYTNGAVAQGLITDAEAALKNPEVTQKVINNLYKNLRTAIDTLISDGKSYVDKECRRIPAKYKTTDEHQGTIERVNYTTDANKGAIQDKDFLVYLPAGYNAADKTKKYDVLYLLHGYGENQNTVFGGPGQNTEMMKVIDNMIYDGKLKPMIIVTPTYSYKGTYDFGYIGGFYDELVNDIMTKVESSYNVYAASTSEADLVAARNHRALGGFSMGSMTTWSTFTKAVKYFKYYMPMSAGTTGTEGVYEGTGEYLASVVNKAGYTPNDVSIFCATGTEDMAYGGMATLVDDMKKVDNTFIYNADLSKGNFYFMTLTGGTHTWNCVNRYLYNMLPDLFNSKSIDPATIPARSYVNFDKNDGTGSVGERRIKDGAVKLPTTGLTQPGAELVGWSTSANSNVAVTPEADGTYNVSSPATLYAVWKWSKPSVACAVTGGAISVDTKAPQNIKLAVGVIDSAISVSGAAISVTPSAIVVSGGVIIVNAGNSITLNVTKSVSNVASNYIIQYAVVDADISDLSGINWNDVTFAGDNSIIPVDAALINRKIYVRVISGTDCKFLEGDAVLLEMK